MSKNTIRAQSGISFLIGALTVLGFAPFYFFPIPLFTLALLCHFWRRSATPFSAALLGFSFGMGMFGAGVTWIYVSLHDFGGMPMAAAVLALSTGAATLLGIRLANEGIASRVLPPVAIRLSSR